MGGTVDYDGKTMSDVPLKISGLTDYCLEGRLLKGAVFCKGESVEVYP
jgi:hypothetical protein